MELSPLVNFRNGLPLNGVSCTAKEYITLNNKIKQELSNSIGNITIISRFIPEANLKISAVGVTDDA